MPKRRRSRRGQVILSISRYFRRFLGEWWCLFQGWPSGTTRLATCISQSGALIGSQENLISSGLIVVHQNWCCLASSCVSGSCRLKLESIIFMSVKRSHHVRRESLEIPTLIQKREEYTLLDFMKI
jgi:hypothetical protein